MTSKYYAERRVATYTYDTDLNRLLAAEHVARLASDAQRVPRRRRALRRRIGIVLISTGWRLACEQPLRPGQSTL
ncbi:MAG TPA: hypothetical protein VN449_04060 [Gaiellaceae bacterium]|nr:hypothetical protein [Gaiellaceae bacterium]